MIYPITRTTFNKYLIIKLYLEEETSLSSIAISNKIAIRTLQRWVAQYKKDGLISELEEIIKDFIINDYYHTIHSTTGETPIVLWNKQQIIPQIPDSIDKLNLLLLTAKKFLIVQRDGILFAGFRYFHPNLIAYIGESIIIHFDLM